MNTRFLEDLIKDRVVDGGGVKNVILLFSAVNEVDFSALERLEEVNERSKKSQRWVLFVRGQRPCDGSPKQVPSD